MRYCAAEELLLASVLAIIACSAHAHVIAGNRYFDGTMTFDDPSVADEAILPYWANPQYPTQGSNVAENRINWCFCAAADADPSIRDGWRMGSSELAGRPHLRLRQD
jgi:hypothetical protein